MSGSDFYNSQLAKTIREMPMENVGTALKHVMQRNETPDWITDMFFPANDEISEEAVDERK